VAAASGGVGALVGQLARRAGARAVGIAGGANKCESPRPDIRTDHDSCGSADPVGQWNEKEFQTCDVSTAP
jgi:NADPH:quinone reductase-like Zn-dependent oxidoreductase